MAQKKKGIVSVDHKRGLLEPNHAQLSVRKQCELLTLNRSSYYYQPAKESELNWQLMRLSDEQYTKTPFYGWRKILAYLREQGYMINHKRLKNLMQKMGLQAIYPRPKTTIKEKEPKIYPYLLRGFKIEKSNQVWSSDITYIPMPKGFMYLTAVIAWYSRYVLS